MRSLIHKVKLRAAHGWTQDDLDEQRKMIVLELLRGEILSFVS